MIENADDPFVTSGDLGDDSRRSPRPWGYAEDLGRYWLPDPADAASWIPGSIEARHMPRGFMRMTNLIGAYADTRALSVWEQNKILRGISEREDLYTNLSVVPRDALGDIEYGEARRIAEAALRQAKTDEAANVGTDYHTALEQRVRNGVEVGTAEMREGVTKLLRLLSDCLLEPIPEWSERIVVNTHLKCAGRFDLPLRDVNPDTGRKESRILMGDLKTKAKPFFTVLEQRAQLAGYARADAMWDEGQQCYVTPPPFDLKEGVLLHLPRPGMNEDGTRRQHDPKLLRVDLAKGWATACRAREVVDDRAEAKSEPMLRRLEMAPPEYATPAHWASRLALVTSLAEGSEVLGRAKEAFPEAAGRFEEVARRRVDILTERG